MKTPIDLATWPRREHFAFFKQYDMPFWGVTAQLDCTRLYDKAKREGVPFSAGYHFASLQARTVIIVVVHIGTFGNMLNIIFMRNSPYLCKQFAFA